VALLSGMERGEIQTVMRDLPQPSVLAQEILPEIREIPVFAAGGIGILIGDGDLSYTPERIAETYYKVGLGALAAITFDYQRLAYPAYNLARGPVSIFGIRYHVQW